MPVDVALNENRRTEWGAGGDLVTVHGNGFVAQSVFISIVENVGLAIPALTASVIEEKRGDIESAIKNNPFSQPPYDVTVAAIDHEDGVVTYTATSKRVELDLDAPRP